MGATSLATSRTRSRTTPAPHDTVGRPGMQPGGGLRPGCRSGRSLGPVRARQMRWNDSSLGQCVRAQMWVGGPKRDRTPGGVDNRAHAGSGGRLCRRTNGWRRRGRSRRRTATHAPTPPRFPALAPSRDTCSPAAGGKFPTRPAVCRGVLPRLLTPRPRLRCRMRCNCGEVCKACQHLCLGAVPRRG